MELSSGFAVIACGDGVASQALPEPRVKGVSSGLFM